VRAQHDQVADPQSPQPGPGQRQRGLLTERHDGTRRLYALRSEALDQVRTVLTELWPDALHRLKAAVEANHPRTGDTDPP